MDRMSRGLTLALLIGLFLTESDRILYLLSPVRSITPVKTLYADPSYTMAITPVYYVYELADIVNKVISSMVLCFVSAKCNYKFYMVACIFLFFNITQVPFYIINRNSNFQNNLLVYAVMLLMIFVWVKPWRHPAKIINMPWIKTKK